MLRTLPLKLGAFAFVFAPLLITSADAAVVVADNEVSGGLLNIFQLGYPTDNLDVTVSGTVTSAASDPSLVGADLKFEADFLNGNGTVTLNGTSLSVTDNTPGTTFQFDPQQATPGMIVFNLLNLNTPVGSVSGAFPNEMFTYADPWSAFGTFPGPPDLELILTIFYDGDFPVKFFDDAPIGAAPSLIPYVEGPFSVTRITLGTEIGMAPPINPTATVPLPLSGLLLISGLGALGLSRRMTG